MPYSEFAKQMSAIAPEAMSKFMQSIYGSESKNTKKEKAEPKLGKRQRDEDENES